MNTQPVAAEFQFFQLPKETIPGLWAQLRPRIISGVDRSSGRLTEDTVFHYLVTGQWQCWAFWEGEKNLAVVVTRLRCDPSGIVVLDAIIASGDERDKWQRTAVDRLKAFGRDEGCSLFEMWARPGWERVFPEFKKTHVLLEFKL